MPLALTSRFATLEKFRDLGILILLFLSFIDKTGHGKEKIVMDAMGPGIMGYGAASHGKGR